MKNLTAKSLASKVFVVFYSAKQAPDMPLIALRKAENLRHIMLRRLFFAVNIEKNAADNNFAKQKESREMKNNKYRAKDLPQNSPELRKMKPRENSDAGIIDGRKKGTHDGGHEKNGGR